MLPVKAFWSVTMYDGKTQLLIENPINRYLINSPMLPDLKKNPDGSITLYIQKDSPGADKESNWLPAPHGPAYVVMRLYWPKETRPRSTMARGNHQGCSGRSEKRYNCSARKPSPRIGSVEVFLDPLAKRGVAGSRTTSGHGEAVALPREAAVYMVQRINIARSGLEV
jgi:Protein of unknown function (DUF1214)